LARAG
jgi:hypothetical protein